MAYKRYGVTAQLILISVLSVQVCVGYSVSNTITEPTSPTNDSTVSVRPRVELTERECTSFEHPFCNGLFGYTYGYFPNHKGQTFQEAVSEFSHFEQLLHTGCSDKLAIFLCFTYFPLCVPSSTMKSVQEVLPCKETCEEVHKSECTEYVVNATNGDGWAEHLDCDQDIFKPIETEQCADGESNDGKSTPDNEDSETTTCEGIVIISL